MSFGSSCRREKQGSLAHDDGESTLVVGDVVDGLTNLTYVGRGKDVTANGCSE